MPTSLSRPLSKALAETMATGASLRPLAAQRRIVSQPSMPGIARSIRIASTAPACASCSSASAACARRRPAAPRSPAAAARCASSVAVDLLVVDHQHAAARAGVAGARRRGQRRAAAPCSPGRNRRTRNSVPPGARPGRRCDDRHLAAHQVGQHLGDRQAQAGAAGALDARRRRHARRARRARRCARCSAGAMPGPVSSISNTAISRTWAAREAHPPGLRELDRVAQHVDEDLAQPLLVGAHHRGSAPAMSCSKRRPLASACSSNMLHDLLQALAQAASAAGRARACRPRCARCPACLRSAHSRCSPPRRITPTACLRCGGIVGSSSSSCA